MILRQWCVVLVLLGHGAYLYASDGAYINHSIIAIHNKMPYTVCMWVVQSVKEPLLVGKEIRVESPIRKIQAGEVVKLNDDLPITEKNEALTTYFQLLYPDNQKSEIQSHRINPAIAGTIFLEPDMSQCDLAE